MTEIDGPFGPAIEIEVLDVAVLERMYLDRCGVRIALRANGVTHVRLHQCKATQVRFWRPVSAAGDEQFYRTLSAAWSTYYREWRWEYAKALELTSPSDRVLEIGCGHGYFLKHTEGRVASAEGVELNREAIANKATSWPVHASTIEAHAQRNTENFDFVCSFQVLEHVTNLASFIESSLACLKPGGILFYSTPNTNYGPNKRREDAFDLPPHHMNYFTHTAYQRIADLYGMKIVAMSDAPTYGALRDPIRTWTLHSMRVTVTDWIRSEIDRLRGRSGMTTFVAMQKSA